MKSVREGMTVTYLLTQYIYIIYNSCTLFDSKVQFKFNYMFKYM